MKLMIVIFILSSMPVFADARFECKGLTQKEAEVFATGELSEAYANRGKMKAADMVIELKGFHTGSARVDETTVFVSPKDTSVQPFDVVFENQSYDPDHQYAAMSRGMTVLALLGSGINNRRKVTTVRVNENKIIYYLAECFLMK